jgi:hypothetical protein
MLLNGVEYFKTFSMAISKSPLEMNAQKTKFQPRLRGDPTV